MFTQEIFRTSKFSMAKKHTISKVCIKYYMKN